MLNSRGKHTQELFANDEVSGDVTISVPERKNKNAYERMNWEGSSIFQFSVFAQLLGNVRYDTGKS